MAEGVFQIVERVEEKAEMKHKYKLTIINTIAALVIVSFIVTSIPWHSDPSMEGWFYTMILLLIILIIPLLILDYVLQLIIKKRTTLLIVNLLIILTILVIFVLLKL